MIEHALTKPTNRMPAWKRFLQQWGIQTMVIPGIIWMIVFNYMPMSGILMAFKDFRLSYKSIFQGHWIGLANFTEFFNDSYFSITMTNTLGISALKLLIGFPLPILFALMLNEIRSTRLKKSIQTISYLPHFLSWVVLGGIMITWLSKSGIINDLLVSLGISDQRVSYLGQPQYFWGLVLISDTWKELGWSAIIYLAAISGIDQQMYEAATVDGAGKLKKIWYITLPSITGTISILFILAVSGVMNSNFDQIFVLKNALNTETATVLDIYTYEMGMRNGRFGYATAIGLFKSVIGTVLLLTANFTSKRLMGRSLY